VCACSVSHVALHDPYSSAGQFQGMAAS
jgi:hypothetical protein